MIVPVTPEPSVSAPVAASDAASDGDVAPAAVKLKLNCVGKLVPVIVPVAAQSIEAAYVQPVVEV